MRISSRVWYAILAILAGACVAAAGSPSIYYSSQAKADAALAAFDKDNPSCQLWTNWKKMCSRTGTNGETLCNTDPDKPVKPSTPFCASRRVQIEGHPFFREPEIPETLTESNNSSKSRNRFCNRFAGAEIMGALMERDIAKRHEVTPLCASFNVDRPFNGMSSKSQEGPRCKKWSVTNISMSYCAEKITDDACHLLTNGVTPPEVTEEGIFAGSDFKSDSRPIWGLYCVKRTEKK